MTSISPLRYPGGKYSIRLLIKSIIESNQPINEIIEPYAGGAAISLWLLANGLVKKAIINDIDYAIYCFWKAVLETPEEIIHRIRNVEITVEEWKKQKELLKSPYNGMSVQEVGFATLFVNRCNRSGIMTKNVGPIGGKNQNGEWKISARFNKENIINKINEINRFKDNIQVLNLDAIDFLQQHPNNKEDLFVYIDPPYYKNGSMLYNHFYHFEDHKILFDFLNSYKINKWVLSYDNQKEIYDLYKNYYKIQGINLYHRANINKMDTEIIILGKMIKDIECGEICQKFLIT